MPSRTTEEPGGLLAAEIAQQLEHGAQFRDGMRVTWLRIKVHDVVTDEAEFVEALDERCPVQGPAKVNFREMSLRSTWSNSPIKMNGVDSSR
jgi:hypothetical protein